MYRAYGTLSLWGKPCSHRLKPGGNKMFRGYATTLVYEKGARNYHHFCKGMVAIFFWAHLEVA
jgi:hypothetical protein